MAHLSISCQTFAALLIFTGSALAGVAAAAQPARPNVLFIAADDLRTDLGAYGNREIHSPNLDALAARGTVFLRAYCQQAVCNPSRASVLTGLRPDTVKVWDLQTHFRQALPDVVTLPQHFKNNGYRAISIGKIYHNQSGARHPPVPFSDPLSWSEDPVFSEGAHWQDWVVAGSDRGPSAKQGAVQCVDAPDNAYFDGKIADAACARLRELGADGEPFFLAVGFWKPHLPFNAPKKYWDLYDREKIAPPAPLELPTGAPVLAGHDSNELRGYAGVPTGKLSPEETAELRHGYYAAISFLDAQVGKVLGELRRLGLDKNTIIVFWSDHGFHLGEHALWGKSTNYELDARTPLIIATPRPAHPDARANGLVELIDIYPTLLELCGLPPVRELQGRSLAPLLQNPALPGKIYAISQHPRPYFDGKMTLMGYALRSDRYRYVEWRTRATGEVSATELYDTQTDFTETKNLASDVAQTPLLRQFAAAVADLFGSTKTTEKTIHD